MKSESFNKIPESSFGRCRWCGEERVRLHYLMCPQCFRLANIIPSKAMVLLNLPEFKRKWNEGVTVKDLVPELYRFLCEEESHFPSDVNDVIHWGQMQKEAAEQVTQQDISDAADAMLADPFLREVPTREELTQQIGMKRTLQFILQAAVERGLLKINLGSDGDDFVKQIVAESKNHVFDDWQSTQPSAQGPLNSTHKPESKGMHSKDILTKKLKR